MIATFTATLNQTTRPHTHNVHELIVGLSGEATVWVQGQRYPISEHNSILIPAGNLHHYEAFQGNDANVAFTCFDDVAQTRLTATNVQSGLSHLLKSGVSTALANADIAAENKVLLDLIRSSLNNGSHFSKEKTENLLSTLLANHLLSSGKTNGAPYPARLDNLKKLVRQIDKNLEVDLCIDKAAERCHMSRSVFTRAFKSYTNLSFTSYITRARLKHAATLLLHEALAIEDVANKSGYRNLGHFYKQFQTQFGMTPNEYRRVAVDMIAPAPDNIAAR